MRPLKRRRESVRHLARAERESAARTAVAGGRRKSAPSSSTDAESAQWKSSSTRTSGSSAARSLKQRAYRTVAADSARAGAPRLAGRERDSDGNTCASSACTSSSSVASRSGRGSRRTRPTRVDEDRERQVALELGRRPREDEVPARLGTSGELVEQPGLPDPRLAHQLDRTGRASLELVEQLLERLSSSPRPTRGFAGAWSRATPCVIAPSLAGQRVSSQSRRVRHPRKHRSRSAVCY